MSIAYHQEIFSKDSLKLYINLNGINSDNTTNKESLSMSIYAFDSSRNEQIFSDKLDYSQIMSLFNQLNSVAIIRNNATTHTSKFLDVNQDVVDILKIFEKVDSSLVKSILGRADENDKLQLVLAALNDNEIQNLHASIRQAQHQKALRDLQKLLQLEEQHSICELIQEEKDLSIYKAGQPEKIFQNWIEKNIWTLGIDYIKKHPARQIGMSSESDLIMETTDGFIDLIELKRPKFDLLDYDNSHKSYYPSKELSKVIGQCLNYQKIMDDYKHNIEKSYRVKLIKPRVKIIIGRTNKFNDDQHEALRLLNANLNHLQIISYDYLYDCGENIISYYSSELKKVIEAGSKEMLSSMS